MKLNTYEDWKYCITELCSIPLTPNYIEDRLQALSNPSDYHTIKFVDTWGEDHLQKTIQWFEQAKQEFK
ncbi:MAG: hypothetical protein AAF988_01685 [Pseudomonadota bacterium]